ncbi:glycosyltransferase family 4 protein [Nitrosarchaeum koreense]|uniref:Putative glycosyl transferases group 1 n=1 Tax=Nitrosarchaeum koreense MY1 TaxID=1001994 RepID=F9CY71_9ARCH|nr:glycosyltransferase family 4 protein [Nitrosarchaeum koreense]EGP92849.1 Putative glycosyl transferases group 1 [Nitrosarchaeum koreense MY1]
MRLLIGGSTSKIFHLKEFASALTDLGVDCKLVVDTDICNGFPSRKVSDWFQTRKKFDQLISEFKPDVILVDRQRHFALAASKQNIPLVIHLRGNIWKEMEWAKNTLYKSLPKRIALQIWISIARQTFQKSSLIVPICEHLEKIVKRNYPNKKTGVMYQGISSSRWYPSKGMALKHPCVGLLQGAVIWGKAQEMLVLENVLKSMPDVTFYWAGDGPYRDKILSALGKHDNFKWLGNLQYPDKVREYLTEIDVYALVSGIDMSPLTLQEAQLMKKPIVATNVGGIPELMKNNETGFLVERGDADRWIEKLSLLINDKEKRKIMGENGRKFVEENFNWNKIAKDFLDILEKIGIK